MRDSEKLITFLEMQNVDVSPFIKLKKNQLGASGCFDVYGLEKFKDIVDNEKDLLKSELYKNNPLFISLGSHKQVNHLSEIHLYNYKSNEYTTIKDLYLDESLTDQEKYEVVYKGLENYNIEYKNYLMSITTNYQTLFKDYNKVLEDDKKGDRINRLVKKRTKLFILLVFVMIVFDILLLRNSVLNQKSTFRFFYNIILNLFYIIPVVKTIYINYFSNRLHKNNTRVSAFINKCDGLYELNDKNLSKLEKDMYLYSSNLDKEISIKYLKNSNIKLKKIHKHALKIFKRNGISISDKFLVIFLKFINLLPIIGIALLIVLSFI